MSNDNTAIQYAFANGEIAPGIWNRREWERWADSVAVAENGYITPTGGFRKRPGMRFLNEALHNDKPITLIVFEFSTDQVYLLEFGENKMRIYIDGNLVLDDDDKPVVIETPYSAEEIREADVAQDRDVLFFAHWDKPLKRLTRYAHDDWRWSDHFTDESLERIASPSWVNFYKNSNGHNGFEYAVTAYRMVNGTPQESVSPPTILANPNDIVQPITQAPQATIESCLTWSDTFKPLAGKDPDFPDVPDMLNPFTVSLDQSQPHGYVYPFFKSAKNFNCSANQKFFDMFKSVYPDMESIHCAWFVEWFDYEDAEWAITSKLQVNSNGGYSVYVHLAESYVYYIPKGVTVYDEKAMYWYNNGYVSGRYGQETIVLKELLRRKVNEGSVNVSGYNITSLHKDIQAFIADWNTNSYIRATNRIQWAKVNGADGYYVYRRYMEGEDRNFYRVATITDGNTTDWLEEDVTETVPEYATPIMGENLFTSPDNYPKLVALYQQRLVLGCTKNNPQTIYGSRTGIYTDFTINPTDDASGYEFKMASKTANPLESFLPIRTLYILTAGGDFVSSVGGAMNASNVNFNQQSYNGSSSVKPIIVGDIGMYVPLNRQTIKSLQYSYATDNFDHNNILYAAQHLTKNKRITTLAHQRDPINLIWALTDDGVMLSCLFVPEQNYLAWTHHKTDGEVRTLQTAPNTSGYDDLFAVTRRYVDGEWVQYIEKFEDMRPYTDTPNSDNSFYVDCGLQETFASPVQEMTGLEHLEGREVAILADFAVQKNQTVKDGRITLDRPASSVVIGLPYEATLKTLNFERMFEGTLRDTRRMVVNAVVEVEDTRELFYSANDGDEEQLIVHKGDKTWKKPSLFTGDVELEFNASTTRGAAVTFKSRNPVPMTINSLVVNLNVGNP